MLFSKKFAGFSVLLLVSVFLPWFSVNIVITKLSIPGYRLGAIGIITVILGIAGVIASTIKQTRFRALIEAILGVISAVLIFISNTGVHSVIRKGIQNMLGGSDLGSATGLFGASSSFDNSQLASLIVGPAWGFYIALIAALGLVGFGAREVFLNKADPLIPSDIRQVWSNPQVQQLRRTVAETASTVATQARETDWKGKARSIKRNKPLMYGGGSVVGIALLYVIALLVYNSTHSLTHAVQNLMQAIKSNQPSQVAALIQTDEQVNPQVVAGFTHYYNQHGDALKQLLAPLESYSATSDGQQSALTNLLNTNQGSVSVTKHNILGFTSYRIVMPVVQMKLQLPDNTTISLDGKSIGSHPYVLPAVYNLTFTANTPFGPVSTTKQEDATGGSEVDDTISFDNNSLTLNSPDIGGNATVTINGKSETVNFQGGGLGSSGSAQLSPVPDLGNANVTVSVKEPWGTFTESGQNQNGQVSLQATADPNNDTFKAVVDAINKYNIADTSGQNSGSYTDELKYLVLNGPAYQSASQKSGKSSSPYVYYKMTANPQLQLVQLGDGKPGIAVNDTETYTPTGFNNGQVNWTYDMEYDTTSQSWLIYSNQDSGQQVPDASPNYTIKNK